LGGKNFSPHGHRNQCLAEFRLFQRNDARILTERIRHRIERRELDRRLERLLGSAERLQPPIDARILRITELLASEPDRNFSQEELARLVGLSPSRFLHLFRQETGLPYRRFRAWNRMMAAFVRLNSGDSLTRAALEAGFADSTHFSHSFRATFGVNPAPVFRGLRRFEIGP
jgi:AraC-like DNA-binding protein